MEDGHNLWPSQNNLALRSIHDHQVRLFYYPTKFKGISISNKECNVILGKDKRISQNTINHIYEIKDGRHAFAGLSIIKHRSSRTIFYTLIFTFNHVTGKSLSEALILVSINPKYDCSLNYKSRQENYKFNICCVHQIFLNVKTKTI